ncbi:hypothetical protein [Amycolatopsis sp. cmx-11-32]|uniref:hypothetical protein n=1 Tax=Amycolatopsis sp. cmx-11-32 TaxID=2785796 RepID=UPI0039E47308
MRVAGQEPAAQLTQWVAAASTAGGDFVAVVSGVPGEDDEQVVFETSLRLPVRVDRGDQVQPLAHRLGDLPAQPGPHPQAVVAAGFGSQRES